jgi:hypothetical protein
LLLGRRERERVKAKEERAHKDVVFKRERRERKE